ncbi:hypothetical protein THARTR1_02147 [Trichoderma harzianum]|uniref:Uncharacterized protein n=1 Tax=Trichoderma harzianum TaxID=5544 RepID=A0A2K0UJM6_TRIHA|nr:hypothetical protein THARTR1_02147 [Trichoderma harzianum]
MESKRASTWALWWKRHEIRREDARVTVDTSQIPFHALRFVPRSRTRSRKISLPTDKDKGRTDIISLGYANRGTWTYRPGLSDNLVVQLTVQIGAP